MWICLYNTVLICLGCTMLICLNYIALERWWEFQHALVVVVDKKETRDAVRKTCTERGKINL